MHEKTDLLLKFIALSQQLRVTHPVMVVTRGDGVWALEKALAIPSGLPGSAQRVCFQYVGSFFSSLSRMERSWGVFFPLQHECFH